jgi:hypothetical protein
MGDSEQPGNPSLLCGPPWPFSLGEVGTYT